MFQCTDHPAALKAYPYHIRDVHISDPFILPDAGSGRYYTYVQFVDSQRFPDVPAGPGHFYVLESPDLIHWSEPQVCFEKGSFWADLDYWAPECHIWQGKYYLISSFRAEGSYRRCQCLVSDTPKGPFRPVREEPLTPEGWHCLDGTLYIDRKGQPWLVFCHEWLQVDDGQICAVPLSSDLGEAAGEPVVLFRASDGPWTGPGGVTDGPFLHRLPGGKLLMLWSSFTPEGSYAISYAISRNGELTGPWDQRKEPLYSLNGGHGMLFRTFSGQLMMACHCPNDHSRKRILLFEMEETANALHIVNEVTGNWYHAIGGRGKRYAYRTPCKEPPCFSCNPGKEETGDDPRHEERKGMDKRSFALGMITAFSECVAGGCKRLALSPPLTPDDYIRFSEEANTIIRKHGLVHYHEQNQDQPEESRVEWILIARRQAVIDQYLALREKRFSPMTSLEPFSELLSYDPAESVHTGYDAYREFFPAAREAIRS